MLVRQPGVAFIVKILGLGCHRVRKGKIQSGECNAECLALGRLYYEALTGVRLFEEIEIVALAGNPLLEKFPSCRELNPEVPEVLSDWISWLIRDADANSDVTAVGLLDEFLNQIGEERRSVGIGLASEGHEEGFDKLLDQIDGSDEGESAENEDARAAKQNDESMTLISGDVLASGKEGKRGVTSSAVFPDAEGGTEVIPGLRNGGAEGRVAGEGVVLTPDDLEFLSNAAATPASEAEEKIVFPGVSGMEGLVLESNSPRGKMAEFLEVEKPFTSVALSADDPVVEGGEEGDLSDEVETLGEIADDVEATEEGVESPQPCAVGDGRAWVDEAEEGVESPQLCAVGNKGPMLNKRKQRVPQWVRTTAMTLGVMACALVVAVVNQYAGSTKIVPSDKGSEEVKAPKSVPAKLKKAESSSVNGFKKAESSSVNGFKKAESSSVNGFKKAESSSVNGFKKAESSSVNGFKKAESSSVNGFKKAESSSVNGSPAAREIEATFLSSSKAATPDKASSSFLAIMPGEEFGSQSSESLSVEMPGLDGILDRAARVDAVDQFPREAEVLEALNDFVGSLDSRLPDVIDSLEDHLVQSAEFGIADEMRVLGERSYALEKWDSAAEWFRRASAKDDVRSKVFLGLMLAQGKGVDRQEEEAAQLFEWAAKRGDQNGLYLAGECYILGRGVAKDPSKGLEYLDAAADLGDLRALDLIGVCHVRGLGTETNYEKALSYFRTAAKNGHSGAMANLGVLYMNGQGLKRIRRRRWSISGPAPSWNMPIACISMLVASRMALEWRRMRIRPPSGIAGR